MTILQLSAVGRIAFIFQYEVSDDRGWLKPIRGEKSITQLRWLHPDNEPLAIWHFEYWSQLCLRAFFSKLIRTAPSYRIIRKKPLQQPHVLCIMGAVGCGKSEATKILRRDFDYHEINTGKLLAGLLKVPPVPTTPREVFQRKAWSFIQSKEGPTQFAEAIVKEMERAPHIPEF